MDHPVLMKTLLAPLLAVLCVSVVSAQDAPVDWQTLATEFSADAAAAGAKYQGRMLTVTGPVSSIAQGDMTLEGTPAVAVVLSTADGAGPDVKCLFEQEDLEPGQQLFVPGDNSEVILRTTDDAGQVTGSRPLVQTGQQIVVTGTFVNFDAGDIVLRHARLAGGSSP
jgi:hypothetical protein